MSKPAKRLAETGKARNAARAAFDARLAQVRGDLEARGIGGRIADKIGEDARSALVQAKDVARESKWVIAGTAAALALWFVRNPIIDWVTQRIGIDPALNEEGAPDE